MASVFHAYTHALHLVMADLFSPYNSTNRHAYAGARRLGILGDYCPNQRRNRDESYDACTKGIKLDRMQSFSE